MTSGHRFVRAFVLAIAALSVTLLAPSPSMADNTYYDGGILRFEGTVSSLQQTVTGGQYSMSLERRTLWSLESSVGILDPSSARRLANGATLVSFVANRAVVEYDATGTPTWIYDASDDPALAGPTSAQRLANGNTLICDRAGKRVIEVDPVTKSVVWRYGMGVAGLGPGQVMDPASAVRLDNGNTLICDGAGAYRVLEIRTADYAAGQPSDGYTTASVAWRYGTDGVSGTSAGLLGSPREAQRIDNGDTLITDEGGHRVARVDQTGAVVWEFGERDTPGSGLTRLDSPSFAQCLADGSYRIADSGNRRVLRVSAAGAATDAYGAGGATTSGPLSRLGSAYATPRGSVLVVDAGNHRVLEVGYAESGRYETSDLYLGDSSVKKWLKRIDLTGAIPESTTLQASYSLNGGSWQTTGTGLTSVIPSATAASRVRVRVDFATADLGSSPAISMLMLTYSLTDPNASGSGGGSGGNSSTYGTASVAATGGPRTIELSDDTTYGDNTTDYGAATTGVEAAPAGAAQNITAAAGDVGQPSDPGGLLLSGAAAVLAFGLGLSSSLINGIGSAFANLGQWAVGWARALMTRGMHG